MDHRAQYHIADSFLAGVLFQVTTGGVWFEGYWWWVCNAGQSTSTQKFALWDVYADGHGAVVPAATVTSGSLTAGQWNYIPLAAPIPLAIGACYNACTGFNGSFPNTNGQFGASEPYSSGITSGPLSAFSDLSGTSPAPFSMTQGTFGTAGTDPTVNMPAQGFGSGNFWMDLQVTDTPPAGSSSRFWPSYPTIPATSNDDDLAQTFGTEFLLSESCTAEQHMVLQPTHRLPASAADHLRDLGCQDPASRLGHPEQFALLVRRSRKRMGVLLLFRNHLARR